LGLNHQSPPAASKLHLKFVNTYCVTKAMLNHTYKLELSGQVLIENKARLMPYLMSPDAAWQVPILLELMCRPNLRERARADRELEVIVQRLEEAAASCLTDYNRPHHQ